MRFAVAMLASAATIEGGQLNILNGGVNGISHPAYPAPFQMVVVLNPEFTRGEMATDWQLSVELLPVDGSEPLAKMTGSLSTSPPEDPELNSYAPVVVPFQTVLLPAPGVYVIRASLGESEVIEIPMRAIAAGETPVV